MLNNKSEEGGVQRVKMHWAAVIWISGREVELKGLWDLGWSRKEDLGESKKKLSFLFLSLSLSASKIAGAGILFVGGGIGGTILYAKWDSHFRKNVEKTIPYSDKLFEMVLGSPPYTVPLPKKPVRVLNSFSLSCGILWKAGCFHLENVLPALFCHFSLTWSNVS